MEENKTIETQEEVVNNEVPNLDNVGEEVQEDISFEEAMKNVYMEDGYLRHQASTELNNIIAGVAQEAVQEVILSTLIKAGLTTREQIAQQIQKYTVERMTHLQADIIKSQEELAGKTEEEIPNLKIHQRSVEIMKEMVEDFIKEATKPVETILAEKDAMKKEREDKKGEKVVEFKPKK